MDYQFALLSWVLFFTAGIGLFVALIAWRRRNILTAQYLALLELSVVIWAFTAAFEAAASTIQLKLVWSQISYIGITGAIASYFFLAIAFGKHNKYLTLRYKLLIIIILLLTIIAVATNNWHHSFYTNIMIIPENNFAIYEHGFLFWIYTFYAYSLLAIGLVTLFRAILRFPTAYKSQSIILIIGGIIPFTGNVMYVFNVNPVPGVDWTPIAFGLSGLILTWGIFRYRLFDLIPVARHKLVETMNDCVLVIDIQGRIVDLNHAMEEILDVKQKHVVGQQALDVFDQWDELSTYLEKNEDVQAEICLKIREIDHFYDMQLTKLFDRGNQFSGKLIMLRDITDRIQSQAELHESQDKYRSVIENTLMGIAVHQNGKIVFSNPMAAHIMGYESIEEYLGTPIMKFVHPEYHKIAGERVKRLLENEGNVAELIEEKFIRKDGTAINVSVIAKSITFDGTLAVQVSFLDITERKLAEEALYDSEEKFRNLVETSQDLIWKLDTDGRYTFVNPAWEDLLGYSPEEMLGHKFIEFKPEEEREKTLKVFKKILKGDESIGYETVYISKEGEIKHLVFNSRVIKDNEGISIGTQGTAHDITERKQSEEKLKNYTRRITAINEASHTLASSLDLKTVVDRCTQIAKQMFDADDVSIFIVDDDKEYLTPIANIGLYSEEIMSTRLKFGEGLTGIVAQHGVARIVNRIDLTDIGKQVPGTPEEPESLMCAPMKIIDEVIGVMTLSKLGEQEFEEEDLSFIENLADISAVEIQNARLYEQAKQSEKLKALFMANMSHEIRTPLNAIIGYTELIEDSVKDKVGSEEKQFFEIIRSSNERLLRTIHGVLDISQLESMSLELQPELIDLNDLVELMVVEHKSRATEKNIDLIYKSKVLQSTIKADKNCISQAVSNLLDNAIKYTKKGQITVSLSEEDRKIILLVKDTGIGMTKKYQKNLFEVFSQESIGYTKDYQGVGLGLALTKRYLDLNEIPITVTSKKNVGTTFTLTFRKVRKTKPITNKEKIEAPLSVETTDVKAEQECVLVVDDDGNAQKLFKYFLAESYLTLFATTVTEAKQQLKENEVDLILLDLSLIGNEDGLDLARHLRKTKKWKDIPIIAVTAHAFTADRDNCFEAGCNDYLSKPVKKPDLLEKIRQYV